MVSKKNFQQNNRPIPYRKQNWMKPEPAMPKLRRERVDKMSGAGNQFNHQFFNTSQIPDNPGYVDFNNMDFGTPATNNPANSQTIPKKKNQKGKPKNKPQGPQQRQSAGWNKNQQQMPGPNKFRPNSQRNFPLNPMPMRGNNAASRMMVPPMTPHGFQRPPMMMPPIPHMRPMRPNPIGAMPPNAPPFLRRSARRPQGGAPFKKQIFPGQMAPMLAPMPPMMVAGPPPMPRMPMPFNNGVIPNMGKIKKPNPKIVKKIVKGKSTIKTLKNLQNQYPLDKPWVTDEIKAEHEKKIEIENKLKGRKDDDLFAQFKTQRDKFVGMYENARDEYLKKEAAQVKKKDVNGKQTNNKTADKSGQSNDINESTNA